MKKVQNALFIIFCLFIAQFCTLTTKFWEYEENAPVRSIKKPGDFTGSGFGTLMIPVYVRTSGTQTNPSFEGDYLAIAGEKPSEIGLFRFSQNEKIIDGDIFAIFPKVLPDDFFSSGFAQSLTGAPLYDDGIKIHTGCIAAGIPEKGGIEIFDIEGNSQFFEIHSISKAGNHIASVIHSKSHPVDGFVITQDSDAVFLQLPSLNEQVLEVNPPIPSPAHITGVTSGNSASGNNPWIAVGSNGRFYIFLFDTLESSYKLGYCIEDSEAGFGAGVFSGDADGDSNEDLIVSGGQDFSEEYEKVIIISGEKFAGNSIPDPIQCYSINSNEVNPYIIAQFECHDFEQRGVLCGSEPLFGKEISVGNLDSETAPEIIISSPGATVDGIEGAGAAFIFKTNSPEPIGVLRASSPSHNQHFASSVTVLSIAGRDEVFIGIPQEDTVLLYYCSNIGDDSSPPGDRFCRP